MASNEELIKGIEDLEAYINEISARKLDLQHELLENNGWEIRKYDLGATYHKDDISYFDADFAVKGLYDEQNS